jgi:hypothetical protein
VYVTRDLIGPFIEGTQTIIGGTFYAPTSTPNISSTTIPFFCLFTTQAPAITGHNDSYTFRSNESIEYL